MLVPIDQYKKSAQKAPTAGRLKFLPPKLKAPVQRPDIRQSENYKNAVTNADRMAQESQKASSVLGMARNFAKAIPRATADVLIGTPAKFIASTNEVEGILRNKQFTDKTYSGKVLGKQIISPFKSFQSDYGNVADKVIAGEKGMGSAAWSLAKIPLAGLETGVGASGIARGLKALSAGQIKNAGAIVSDAFLPTNFSKGLKPLPSRGTARSMSQDIGLAQDVQKGVQVQSKLQPLPERGIPLPEGNKSVPLDFRESSSYTKSVPQNSISGKSGQLKQSGGVVSSIKVKTEKAVDPFNEKLYAKLQKDTKDVSKAIDNVVKQEAENLIAMQKETGGVTMLNTGSDYLPGAGNFERISSNPGWYRKFYKENGRAPGKKEVYEMAKKNLENGTGQFQDEYNRISSIGKSIQRKASQVNPQRSIDKVNAQIESGTDFNAPKTANISFSGVEKSKIPVRFSRDARTIPEKVGLMKPEAPTGSKLYPNILRSGESSLENQGQAGQALKGLMKEEQVAGDLQAGKWKSLVKQFTSQLDDAQRSNLTDVLEGKANPMDKPVADASVVMRNLLNKVQRTAKETGLDVGYREDYFPRQYNWDEITKGKRKEEVLQHMVESGQASTKAEAENFLRDFVGKNRERKAGNLEYERLFDIPGYEKDPEKALSMYADSAARRISEAKYFGPKDEVTSALINKVAEGGGDYREAQKIFDNIYKGEDKNAFAQFLLGYNAFTKLSLGFFSNLTQSVNTSTKAGLLNTIKGAGQALAQGVKAVKGKNYDDLAVLANTLDDHVVMQESGLSNKFIQGAMYFFQKIESFNRRTATYAGANRAKELANILKSDPKSSLAIRQLESLGIKAEDVVNGKLTQEQLLKAANKMTRITQFKIDSLNLPTAWRTPLGKVLSQFKSFSFMQTKFIRDEIVKEARLGNFAPLARFIVLAPMASYATQSMRNAVNNNEKSEPSFRKFDLYRKAVGDLPSDFATQMQYANEKKDKWYTTPLRNVKNFSSPFIGPTGGDILEIASSLEQKGKIADQNDMWYSEHPEAQKDPNLDLKRFGVSKIPYVGRMLTNTYLGYGDTVAQEAKKKAIEAIQKQDWKALSEAQEQDPYLRRDRVFSNLMKEAGVDKKDPADKALYEEIQKRKANPFYK